MTELEKSVPPAGEEIHLPGGSLQPLLVAAFTTIGLLGVTMSPVLVVIGTVGLVWTIARWIADTRRDINELPLHHDDH